MAQHKFDLDLWLPDTWVIDEAVTEAKNRSKRYRGKLGLFCTETGDNTKENKEQLGMLLVASMQRVDLTNEVANAEAQLVTERLKDPTAVLDTSGLVDGADMVLDTQTALVLWAQEPAQLKDMPHVLFGGAGGIPQRARFPGAASVVPRLAAAIMRAKVTAAMERLRGHTLSTESPPPMPTLPGVHVLHSAGGRVVSYELARKFAPPCLLRLLSTFHTAPEFHPKNAERMSLMRVFYGLTGDHMAACALWRDMWTAEGQRYTGRVPTGSDIASWAAKRRPLTCTTLQVTSGTDGYPMCGFAHCKQDIEDFIPQDPSAGVAGSSSALPAAAATLMMQ